MGINTKVLKMIRRYIFLKESPNLKEEFLVEVYEKASKKERDSFKDEMNTYFDAIEDGRIRPGESITEQFKNLNL